MNIKIKFFVSFALVCICFQLNGQSDTSSNPIKRIDYDKLRFERIMEGETRTFQPDENDRHKYYLIPEQLPKWFFKPGNFASSTKFVIGISDPGLDSSKAFKQAILRAKALLLLSKNARVENISDHYSVTREAAGQYAHDSQFLDFTRVGSGKSDYGQKLSIDQKFYTKYEEGIVLVSLGTGDTEIVDTLLVTGELMQLAREEKIALENTVFCRFIIQNKPSSCPSDSFVKNEYTFKSRENKLDIISTMGSDTFSFPVHPYRYLPSSDSLPEDTAMVAHQFSLRNGLWNAYINLILSKVNFHNKYLKSKIKTSYDNYSIKNQDLIRTVSRNLFSFSLQAIEISDQELKLNLRFTSPPD